MVIQASRELDKYIVDYYKEQGYAGHLVPGGQVTGN